MNIYSGSREGRGLAAALTNPTEISLRKGTIKQPYPVVIYGHSFPDAETAYFALVKQHGAEGQVTTSDQIMIQVITTKFQQHPRLQAAVLGLGGTKFLESCSHFTFAKTERFQKWEGVGRQSRFIRNLIAGYESAILPPA
jgi:hypothetical protein